MREGMSERMSQDMSERMSANMSERMSEDMPARMPRRVKSMDKVQLAEPWLCLWLMPLCNVDEPEQTQNLEAGVMTQKLCLRAEFGVNKAQACIMMFLTSVHRSQRMELAELSKRFRQIILWHAWHCACLLSEHPDE